MWPIHFDFLLFTVRRIFLSSLTPCYISSFLIQSVHPSPAPHSKTLRAFLFSFLKGPGFSTLLTCCKYRTLLVSSLNLSPVFMLRHVLMITTMKYETDRLQAYVARFYCLLSRGKGGASRSLLSHLAVLLDSRLSLSFFDINLGKAGLITRTSRSLNAIVPQSKNCSFGISNNN